MDALVQLARTEGETTVGATLYCTTYPCHSCARHIVAAGIKKVIYIEPYEKSLALSLHSDSISTIGEMEGDTKKVYFVPFEGVSPHRYFRFFKMVADRKEGGKALINSAANSYHVDPQFLDSYYEYEEKVVAQLSADAGAK